MGQVTHGHFGARNIDQPPWLLTFAGGSKACTMAPWNMERLKPVCGPYPGGLFLMQTDFLVLILKVPFVDGFKGKPKNNPCASFCHVRR